MKDLGILPEARHEAFPRTREERPPHWTVQVALVALMAGTFLLACFL